VGGAFLSGEDLGLPICTKPGILLSYPPTRLDAWENMSWADIIPNCSLLESLLSAGLNMQER
jgi:hypothetical protein